ncbi:hypothetical protein CANCADRAFT_1776 [Tortispora caseinolytica NRRL Y-17796]|uniref:Oxo-4-hydroxy-4-carboxy-5-ureidoimidazoline decarboxylase domain-containing protein n=1 Tax=Tortispora caseinolytica NRRL Y-17796 TaxID=767744 RepID=A0A1E4TE56_9ASCO|nr:hypothetical protein CANCADRAFT_1776 [Tortispora caseinolytica NRRL Y-17796]
MNLPSPSTFINLDAMEQKSVLDKLFEPSQILADKVRSDLEKTEISFTSYDEIAQYVGRILRGMNSSESIQEQKDLLAILGAHPRLGAKKVESAQSQQEQASLQAAAKEEQERLAELNAEYERTFPGMIYVVFVNGRSREEIMKNMRERIDRGRIDLEKLEAIDAMCAIAIDRSKKLLANL